MMIQPTKFQVSYAEGTKWQDFTNLPEAEEFMTQCSGADLVILDDGGNELELIGEYYHRVDTEPFDDGYDYDRYY